MQDRLVTINLVVCATLGPKARVPKRARDACFRSRIKLLAKSAHRLSKKGRQWACSGCQEAVTDSELGMWLRKGTCKGRPPTYPVINTGLILDPHAIAMAREMHSSLRFAYRKGVLICKICGATVSSNPQVPTWALHQIPHRLWQSSPE